MRRLIILFWFILSQVAFSQVDSLHYYYNKGEYDKAIKFGNELVKYQEKKDYFVAENYAMILEWLLGLSLQQKNLNQAEFYCNKLIEKFDVLKNNPKAYVKCHYSIGVFYFDNKSYQTSKNFLQNGITMAEANKIQDETYFSLLNLLKTVNIKFENFAKNIKTTTERQSDSINYYYKKGDFQKAIKYGEQQKSAISVKDFNYMVLCYDLASSYSKINDFRNSELNHLEVIELKKNFSDQNDIVIANTYRILANDCAANNDFTKAAEYFKKAIETYKKGNNTKQLVYTDCILDYAPVLRNEKKFNEAEKLYIEVEQILKIEQGENNINYQKALISAAIFYDVVGNNAKSDELFLKSYTLQKLNFKDEFVDTLIFTIDFIALNFNRKKEYSVAEKYYKENLEYKKKYLGENSIKYIAALCDLGRNAGSQNNSFEALKYYKKSNALFIKSNKEFTLENAIVLKDIALSLVMAGNYDQVEIYLKKLSTRQKFKDIDSQRVKPCNQKS